MCNAPGHSRTHSSDAIRVRLQFGRGDNYLSRCTCTDGFNTNIGSLHRFWREFHDAGFLAVLALPAFGFMLRIRGGAFGLPGRIPAVASDEHQREPEGEAADVFGDIFGSDPS
ncbi:MAG: hypothetical protein A3H97_01790 [Acidobacteria bacterium RIFCSPLOWO2_02_FULL_65_29]|nr:MAG: hypothetical protein A3H97_01790 [Acidobacteria bacterium RIFCSPLOWO2_02_FULL_65_29]